MNPFWEISYIIQDIRHWCLDISSAIYSSALVPDILGDWFYNLYTWLGDVQLWFADAGNWYENTIDQLQALWKELDKFLDWDYWKSVLEDIWEWWLNWYRNVRDNILDWWDGVYDTVKSWVLEHLEPVYDWVLDIISDIKLWVKDTFLPLSKWLEIPSLINSWFIEKLGINWLDVWQNIKDFFTDTIPKTAKELWNWFWDWAKELPFISKEDAEVIAEEEGEAGKEAKHWWDIFLEDTKAFFAGPITWLLGKWDWDTFFGWVGPFFEAAGGTEAERDEEYNKVPQVDENIDEKAKMLRDEELYELDETWSLISPEIDKIRAKIKSEVE
jgi:hypothetical protein